MNENFHSLFMLLTHFHIKTNLCTQFMLDQWACTLHRIHRGKTKCAGKSEEESWEMKVLRYVMQNRMRKYILFPPLLIAISIWIAFSDFEMDMTAWFQYDSMVFIWIKCLIWKCSSAETKTLMQHLIAMMRSWMRHLHHSQHSIWNYSFRNFIEIHMAVATYVHLAEPNVQSKTAKTKKYSLKQVQTVLQSQTQHIYIFFGTFIPHVKINRKRDKNSLKNTDTDTRSADIGFGQSQQVKWLLKMCCAALHTANDWQMCMKRWKSPQKNETKRNMSGSAPHKFTWYTM